MNKEVFLPKTEFSQKANGAVREPELINFWNENKIIEKRNALNNKAFSLHDGMPYANGDIHIGHLFNKNLKDVINRYKLMTGNKVEFVPFFDCHGLPTELKAIKGNKELPSAQIRKICHNFALENVEKQKTKFQRFGLMGNWDNEVKTLDIPYELKQLEVFYKLWQKGFVFKKHKPTIYSPSTKTVLADAELEYFDVKSNALYIKFKTTDNRNLIAYTTTEWTLKGNQAICLNKDIQYVEFVLNNETYITSEEYAKAICNTNDGYSNLINFPTYYYNLNSEICPVVFDNYVQDSETAVVHICGGHGEDDHRVCLANNIVPHNVVENLKDLPEHISTYKVDGSHIFTAKEIEHSYPHDWRTKEKVYYCLTEQFFINLDKVKPRVLEVVQNEVDWTNNKFKNRMINSISSRSEWCISRQRSWGFPIPLFLNLETKQYELNDEMYSHLISQFREFGSNVWFEKDLTELLPDGYDVSKYEKVKDTLDVWFDSGMSFYILYGLENQSDLYVEGIDQYRGWFQSSLLISVMLGNKAPYKKVISHDFVLDEKGNKMSKSLGNVVNPDDLLKKYNVDILRLWTISNDYESGVRISNNILDQCFNSYFRIRNSLRFLLSNLYDFDYQDYAKYMTEKDIVALEKFHTFKKELITLYEQYNFKEAYQLINNYFSELSSNYFDLENKAYLYEAGGFDRKRVQQVYNFLAIELVKLLAPLVPFLAEDFYSHLTLENKKESIFLEEIK